MAEEGYGRGKQVAQRGSDYQQQQAIRRAQEQQTRQAERERKAAETASKRQERERKAAYQEQQAEQAQVRTIGVEYEVEQLGQLLRDALVGDPPTTFERRRRTHTPTKLNERPWSRPEPSPRWEEFAPPEPGGLAAALGLGRKRYEAEVAEARAKHKNATSEPRRSGWQRWSGSVPNTARPKHKPLMRWRPSTGSWTRSARRTGPGSPRRSRLI